MSRDYPALELSWPSGTSDDIADWLLAALDETGITAAEELGDGLRLFFTSAADRDRALTLVSADEPAVRCAAIAVPDEGWAERSQAVLTAVRVGALVVAPPWAQAPADASADHITIVIQPSMGFGTGHHASTRLVLRLLQDLPLGSRSLLDVGTGSGVLALAAWRLGARPVVAIDYDEDALTSAAENVDLNGATGEVLLERLDLSHDDVPHQFDVLTANLTGAMLERFASRLARMGGGRRRAHCQRLPG